MFNLVSEHQIQRLTQQILLRFFHSDILTAGRCGHLMAALMAFLVESCSLIDYNVYLCTVSLCYFPFSYLSSSGDTVLIFVKHMLWHPYISFLNSEDGLLKGSV